MNRSHTLILLVWQFLVPGKVLASADTNLIDRFIEQKARQDRVPLAAPCSDSDYIRRITLDLTGRLPSVDDARKFVSDTDPAKRKKLIDSLFPPLPVMGMRSLAEHPFLDRWAYFFNDLFRNGELLGQGINTFYDYIYKTLTLNVHYDEFVTELLTAQAVSTFSDGPSNFIARSHVFEGDGYMMNYEDTFDEIAINTGKLFLGVNLECVSCHDGRGHLEKINLWLTERKRTDLFRQASFFGKTFIGPVYGRFPHFRVKDNHPGYNLTSVSSLRPPRKSADPISPAFILDGARPAEGESYRQAFARMATTHPQFARATVNLIWAELMGQGIVDPVFDFDLKRQDPKNPPPAPWTIQPSHPELLDALADDFRRNGHDLRRLIRTIVSSQAYQRSAEAPAGWKATYERHFARRVVRRLSAQQLFDSISEVTGVFPEIKVTYSDKKVRYLMQARSPQDTDKTDRGLNKVMQSFGQCDRYTAEADLRPSMVQSALLLNDRTIRERVKVQKGSRLERLLKSGSNEQIVDELFWAAVSRPPSTEERATALDYLNEQREQRAEDLVWAMINRLDFLFY